MNSTPNWEPKKSAACIYCGAKENLTDEHVIPFSLGGLMKIEKGSCRSCAEITSKFERTVARTMIGNFRVKFGAPTRRMKERPSNLILNVLNGSSETEHKLKPEDHPGAIFLPIFSPSRVFTGTFGFDTNLHQSMQFWSWPAPEHFHAVVPKDLPEGAVVKMATLKINAFVRLLAKIAHCHSFSLYGEGVFTPLLAPLILGKTNEYSNYIGGSNRRQPDINSNIAAESTVRKFHGTWFLVNTVHFFPKLGGPSYDLIVGTCADQSESIGAKMPGSGLP
jgi:hypothetical protein